MAGDNEQILTSRPVYPNWPKSLSGCPMVTPHLHWKFHANRSSRFLVMLLTKKQRNRPKTIPRPPTGGGVISCKYHRLNNTMHFTRISHVLSIHQHIRDTTVFGTSKERFKLTVSQGMFFHLHGFYPLLLPSMQSMHPVVNKTCRNKVNIFSTKPGSTYKSDFL